MMVDGKTGDKANVLYDFLGTASDLDKVDFETRKNLLLSAGRITSYNTTAWEHDQVLECVFHMYLFKLVLNQAMEEAIEGK